MTNGLFTLPKWQRKINERTFKIGFCQTSIWIGFSPCTFWLLLHLFPLFYQIDCSFLWLLVRPQEAQLPLQRIHPHSVITAPLALYSCQGLHGAEGRDPKPLVCVIVNQKASRITLTSSGDIIIGFLWRKHSHVVFHCLNTTPINTARFG